MGFGIPSLPHVLSHALGVAGRAGQATKAVTDAVAHPLGQAWGAFASADPNDAAIIRGLNPGSRTGLLNLASMAVPGGKMGAGERMGAGLMPEDLSYSRLPPEPPLQRRSGEAPPPRPSGRGSTMTVKEAQKNLDAAVKEHTDLFARVETLKHQAGMYNAWGDIPEVDFSASNALLHQARMREIAARDDLRSAKVAQTKLLAASGKPVFTVPSKPYTKVAAVKRGLSKSTKGKK